MVTILHKKRGRGPGLGELPKILRFPFNISATAEARKNGRGHGLGKLSKILEFPFNIFATVEARVFKFVLVFQGPS